MELFAETIYGALESVYGTAIDPPTRFLNLSGVVVPAYAEWAPDEATGILAARRRTVTTRRMSTYDGGGPADTMALPFLANTFMKAVTTPAIPGGGTNSRLWTFPRMMTADDHKSMTLYSGDGAIQQFQAAGMRTTEYKLSADASAEDGVTHNLKCVGNFPTKDPANSLPAQAPGPLLIPGQMQLWIDTTEAIATTEYAGGILTGAELTVPTGAVQKWGAAGVTAGKNPTRIGRSKGSPSQVLTLEVVNTTLYDLFGTNDGDTICKVRVRINGPVIESTLRHYIQWDMIAPLRTFGWSEIAGTNRGMQLTQTGEYDSSAATDLTLYVQNTLAALP